MEPELIYFKGLLEFGFNFWDLVILYMIISIGFKIWNIIASALK